jgi:hypothetical protein
MNWVLALAHLRIPRAIDIGDGVTLSPLTPAEFDGAAPDSKKRYDDAIGEITSAIETEIASESEAECRKARVKLEGTRLCLCMIRPSLVEEVGETRRPQVGARTTGGGGWLARISRYNGIEFSDAECDEARRLHTAFAALGDAAKAGLKVPMERLSMAQVEWRFHAPSYERDNPVHQVIDLGISLEALLLNDKPDQELSYRFALRGAHLMGGADPAKRREFYRVFSALYSLRSTAVHSGVMPKKIDNPRNLTPAELLRYGLGLSAEAIRKVIYEGRPDWERVVLG